MDKVECAKSLNIKTIIESETGTIFKENNLLECPFCKSGTGKNKSSAFNVKPSNNIFKCFACEKTGNPIEFIKYFHTDFSDKQSIDYILDNYSNSGIIERKQVDNADASILQKTIFAIQKNDITKATIYLKNRGILVDQLPKNSYYYDSYEDAVVVFDSKRVLANKRLINPPSKQKARNVKGSVELNAIYDCTFDPNKESVFITEGVINALSFFENSAIAIFSTNNKITDINKLSHYIKEKRVILAFDEDAAGVKCTEFFTQLILDSGIQIKELLQLKFQLDKDANNYLVLPDVNHGNQLKKILKEESNYLVLFRDQNDAMLLLQPIPRNSKDKEKDFREFQVYVKDGCYWTKTTAVNNISVETKISNFLMEILFHFIDGTNNTRRLIKIQHHAGEITIIEILSSELKPEILETFLKSKRCTFLGSSYQLKRIFMDLMEKEREANVVDTLGFMPLYDIYAFSDCILNEHNRLIWANTLGIVTDKDKTYYFPASASSNLKNEVYNTIRKFRYLSGNLTFQEWSKLVFEAYQVNGSIGICFAIMGLFRDIIFSELGFIPFLFLFGPAGVGKGSFIDSILRLFGEKDIGIPMNSTTKAIARSAEQRTNAFVFYKEYQNKMERSMLDFFKNAYDGALYSIAQATGDNKTTAFFAKSAVIIDGNVLPTAESAIFDRMIVLSFESDKFTKVQTDAHRMLIDEAEKGLGQIVKEVLKFRDYFKDNFKSTFRKVHDKIKYENITINDVDINTLPERTIKHISLILSTYQLMSTKLVFPFDYDTLFNKTIQDAVEKYQMLTDIKDVSIFWDAVNWDRNKSNPTIQVDKHYVKDFEKKIIYMKINEMYSVYMSYCKHNEINYIDKSSLTTLLTSTSYPPFIESTQKGRHKTINKRGLGECYMYHFDTNQNDNILIINKKEVTL